MKHTQLVALLHMLAFVHRYLAGRDFGHPNGPDAHQANAGVVGFDENHRACGHLGYVVWRSPIHCLFNHIC